MFLIQVNNYNEMKAIILKINAFQLFTPSHSIRGLDVVTSKHPLDTAGAGVKVIVKVKLKYTVSSHW